MLNTLPAQFIKYYNSNNISVKIMINFNNSINFKKGDILTIVSMLVELLMIFHFIFILKGMRKILT